MKKHFLLAVLLASFLGGPSAFAIGFGTLVSDEPDANVYPDGVFFDGISVDEDQTSAAASAVADDVSLPDIDTMLGEEVLYIGSNTVFDEIFFDITTAGDSSRACIVGDPCGHYSLAYYDSATSDWEGLSYTDGTNNFETAGVGTLEFEIPETWVTTSVNGQTLFWIRLSPAPFTSITTAASVGEVALHAYNFELTVQDELGNAFQDLTGEDFSIDEGSFSADLMRDRGEGVYQFALNVPSAFALSDSGHTISVRARGYVDEELSTGSLSSTQTSGSLVLEYSHVISVKNAIGLWLTPDSVSVGNVDCTISGTKAYCPLTVSQDDLTAEVSVSKVGYFPVTTNLSASRGASGDAQVETVVELTRDASVCVAEFDDISGHWAEPYIDSLYCRGVVNGKDEDTFDPGGDATRAEFLKIALLNAGYDVEGATGEDFSDVSAGDWFYEYVSFGAEKGFIEGYGDGSFRPNDSINRAEALAITMRIAGVDEYEVDADWDEFDDVGANDWFAYAVETAADLDIVGGYDDGTFRPGNNITRAEVTAVSVRTYDEYYAE